MIIKYVCHQELNNSDLERIIHVKSIAWPYSRENQLKWIENNIKNDDIHVLLFDENKTIIAYLNLILVDFVINGENYSGYGIGNVCAARKGNGDGGMLMSEIKKYFITHKMIGLLFCKEETVDFYKKYGWEALPKSRTIVHGIGEEIKVMIINYDYNSIEQLVYKQKIF